VRVALRRLIVTVFLASGAIALAAAPIGHRATPPLWDLTGTVEWLTHASPDAVAALLVRSSASLFAAHLALVALVLSLTGERATSSRGLALVVPSVSRRVIAPLLGLSIVASASLAGASEVEPEAVVVDETRCDEDPDDCATLVLLDEETASIQLIRPLVVAPHIGDHHGQLQASEDSSPRTWTVEAGDHFWSIARRTLAQEHGVTLEQHWRALIELNRDRLPDPCNPDLIYPDMVLRLR